LEMARCWSATMAPTRFGGSVTQENNPVIAGYRRDGLETRRAEAIWKASGLLFGARMCAFARRATHIVGRPEVQETGERRRLLILRDTFAGIGRLLHGVGTEVDRILDTRFKPRHNPPVHFIGVGIVQAEMRAPAFGAA